ncbi:thymidine phosphorylase, partial [archaeon]|nr:thymidine phosphorylase [archaeon]
TLDKHCIGGVPNNRTTMIVIPIITALGYTMPKTSSRAITSPAGTADTMECLSKVELTQKEIIKVVNKVGGCMAHGGSMNLAPADDKIIKIEHPLSIDAEGQLLASVMAKKYSVSSNYVLIDIPMGKTTKAKTRSQAEQLKKKFVSLGKSLGMKVKVIVTDGSQPIGNGIGPLLESEDVMKVLSNDCGAPSDLRKKSLFISGTLLEMIGEAKKGKGYQMAKEVLDDGRALKQMNKMINAQGKIEKPKLGKFKHHLCSKRSGKVKKINNALISKLSHYAGAPVDKGSGMYLYKKVGDTVKAGEKLFTLYAVSKAKLKFAIEEMKKNNPYLVK